MAFSNELNLWGINSTNIMPSSGPDSLENNTQSVNGFLANQPLYSAVFNGIFREMSLVTVAFADALGQINTSASRDSLTISNSLSRAELATAIINIFNNMTVANATNATTATTATSATTATNATHLSGGAKGKLVYQSAPNTTAFLSTGSNGQILMFNGTSGLPEWSSPSATIAGISGGSAGSIPYQSAPSTTTFLGKGTTGQILTQGNSNAPIWTNQSNLSVGSATNATNATKATHIAGGAANYIPVQTDANTTGFIQFGNNGNYVLATNSAGTGIQWRPASDFIDSTQVDKAENLVGGSAGTIPYQDAENSTKFINAGTSGYLLQSNGTSTAPSFVSPDSLTVVRAKNINGGDAGKIPYQTSPSGTAFTDVGNSGQVLISGGQGAPTWVTPSSSLDANTAKNIKQNKSGTGILYQSANNTTSQLSGTSGYLLKSNGTNAPSFVNPSNLTVGTAAKLSDGLKDITMTFSSGVLTITYDHT